MDGKLQGLGQCRLSIGAFWLTHIGAFCLSIAQALAPGELKIPRKLKISRASDSARLGE